MKEIGIRELRNALSAWVRRVERGERVAVTDHGRIVAVLSPASAEEGVSDRYASLVAAGVIRPATESGPFFRGMKTLRLPRGTAARLVDEDRG